MLLLQMKKNKLIKNISITFIVQLVVAFIGVLIIKILSSQLSEENFGAYLIIKRIAGIGFPVMTLNLGMSLARYCSINKNKAEQYLLYSLFIIIIFLIVFVVISFRFEEYFAKILFGNSIYSLLIIPTILFLFTQSLFVISVGYFRGGHNFIRMNVITTIFWLLALIVIFIPKIKIGGEIQYLTHYLLIFSILTTIVITGYTLLNIRITGSLLKVIKLIFIQRNYLSDREFFKYGISRFPAGFLFPLVFFIPMFTASNLISLKVAAYVGVLVSVIRLVQMIGQPFNMILLPKFAEYKSCGNRKQIKENCKMVVEYCLIIPFFIGMITTLFAPEIVRLWFGEKYSIISNHLMYLSPSIGFLLVFVIIKGILDGIYSFPYSNYIGLFGCLSTFLVVVLSVFCNWELEGLAASLFVGNFVLGFTSLYILIKKQKLFHDLSRSISPFCCIIIETLLVLLLNSRIYYENLFVIIVLKMTILLLLLAVTVIVIKKVNSQLILFKKGSSC